MILKNSKNFITILCIMLLISASSLYAKKSRGAYATKNIIGQDYYLKACSSCHGEGNRAGNMASIREWKELFSQDAAELKDLHLDDEENISLLKYMDSKKFNNEKKLMLKFLQEFAYDSEHIPTCN